MNTSPRRHPYRVPGVIAALLTLSLGLNIYWATTVAAQRTTEPRIAPVPQSEWNEEQAALLQPLFDRGAGYNVYTTMAQHTELARDWMPFGNHVLYENTLKARDREILILRIGWLCQAEYEWAQHVRIGKGIGLSDDDIRHIMDGPKAKGLTDHDRLLMQAADELHEDAFITDATWNALAENYDTKQMMDIVFTVGQYNLVSMALNSFGVQLDPGLEGFPVDL